MLVNNCFTGISPQEWMNPVVVQLFDVMRALSYAFLSGIPDQTLDNIASKDVETNFYLFSF